MDLIKSKELAGLLCLKWGISSPRAIFNIMDELSVPAAKGYLLNDFEFSLIEGIKSLRFIHLFFWQQKLNMPLIKAINQKRMLKILEVMGILSRIFRARYNLRVLNKFFDFNLLNGLWPIQFGLECSKGSKPKAKVYLSLGEYHPERKTCFNWDYFKSHFGLQSLKLGKSFNKNRFDSVAVDLSANQGFVFKLYPYSRADAGRLYRIRAGLKIGSVKSWQRFREGIPISNIPFNAGQPAYLMQYLENNKFKVHYICRQASKKSFYFR